jgi:hypothetical protein
MESVNSLQSFLILIFPKVYLIPAFFMSNQPLCIERFSMLLAIIITMSMVGQGIGLFFGATFDIPVASYFAPISCIPFLLVSGFMLKFNAIPSYLSWITYLSFLHYGFEGSMLTIYDRERPPLSCSQSYCHFRYPVKFLEQFDLTQSSYFLAIVGMRILFYRDTSGWLLRVAFQIAAHTFSRYSFILLFHLSFICVVHRTSHPLLINKKN